MSSSINLSSQFCSVYYLLWKIISLLGASWNQIECFNMRIFLNHSRIWPGGGKNVNRAGERTSSASIKYLYFEYLIWTWSGLVSVLISPKWLRVILFQWLHSIQPMVRSFLYRNLILSIPFGKYNYTNSINRICHIFIHLLFHVISSAITTRYFIK